MNAQQRLVMLAEMIQSAIDNHTEPDALADALESILSDAELGFLRSKSNDQVLALLDTATDAFREVATRDEIGNAAARERRVYVAKVMDELRHVEGQAGAGE